MASSEDRDRGRGTESDTRESPRTPEMRDEVLTELLEAGLSSRETIGPYRLLRQLGEGGMGVVYEAEQAEPIHRRVAVKVVKEGMHSKEVLARFETERQALAVMDHPGIATVFDGGTTDTGRPYFAMELVHGDPIVEYCDRRHLGTEQRLRLFVDVCRAVQHAHQKGVIHRDIKPSNVLVQEIDQQPQVKVIDFGVAKAVGRPLTDLTVLTVRHQLLGTPAFMSPEQLDPSGLDIDTRTDVYSLGVLLYVLLTGELPFGGGDDRTSLDELRRRVLSEEPVRPSRRQTTMRDGSVESPQSLADLRTHNRQLRGDLDWITLRALEKQRSRRYESVSELAADVHRHLNHEPVSAGPPSLGYRMGKFVRRHRAGVAMAGALALMLIASVVMVSVALVRARRSEEEARTRAVEAEKVRDFLVEVFDASDPYVSRGEEPSVRDLLERGAERIGDDLRDQPATRTLMLATLGRVMLNQGLHERADELLAEAELEATRLEGRDDIVATVGMDRSFALVRLGRPDEALELAQRAAELRRQRFGEIHPDVRAADRSLGWVQLQRGEWEQAIEILRRALEIDRQLGATEPLDTADLERLIGFGLHQIGDPEAEAHVRRAYELYNEADPEHPNLAWALSELASFASSDGRLEEAVSLYSRALDLQRRTLGEDHLVTADTLNDIGVAYWYAQRFSDAEQYFLEALAVRQRHFDDDNPALAQSYNNLALISRAQVRLEDAERYYRRALEIGERAHGIDAPANAGVLSNLALLLLRQRRPREAEPLALRSLEIRRRALGESAPATFYSRLTLAHVTRALGEVEQASRRLRELRAEILELDSPPEVLTQSVATALATTLTLLPDLPADEIDALLDEVEGALESPDVPDSRRDVVMMDVLLSRTTVRAREGDTSEAERLYQLYLDLHSSEEPSALGFYLRARILSLLDRRTEARAALAEAQRGGFSEFPPESDPALVALRESPEYKSLVRDYRRPWAGSGASD